MTREEVIGTVASFSQVLFVFFLNFCFVLSFFCIEDEASKSLKNSYGNDNKKKQRGIQHPWS